MGRRESRALDCRGGGHRRGLPGASLQLVTVSAAPADQRPDLVLIVVDALRADRLSLYGYSRPTTPRLAARKSRLLWFTDAISDATQTVPAVASLFTGVPPHQHGIQFDTIGSYFPPYGASPRLDTPLPTMAETLRESGYYTIGVVGNPWLMESTRFSRGFARFDDWKVWDRKGVNDDAAMMQAAIDELVPPSDSPRFVWVHLMSVHNPYDKGHRSLVREAGTDRYVNGPASPSAGDLAFMSDLYDSNVAYADSLIGALIDRLASRPRQRPVVVCVVGDHGDELLEHGGLGHGTTLFHELARVPVVVWGPGVVRRTGAVGEADSVVGRPGHAAGAGGTGIEPAGRRGDGPGDAAADGRAGRPFNRVEQREGGLRGALEVHRDEVAIPGAALQPGRRSGREDRSRGGRTGRARTPPRRGPEVVAGHQLSELKRHAPHT